MNEAMQNTNAAEIPGTTSPGPQENSSPKQPHLERLELIRKLQSEALGQADVLLANLQVINSDLHLFACQLRERIEEESSSAAASAEGFERFARRIELYLKIARQIDRLTQISRQQHTGGQLLNSAAKTLLGQMADTAGH